MSSGITRKYAPDDVTQTIGTQAITGLKLGSFVEAEYNVDQAELDIGSDGEATMIISPNRSGTVKITLQQSSPLNDVFTAMYLALQQKDTVNGVKPYRMKDANGSTVVSAAQMFIKKPAKIVFADKAEGREWELISGYLNIAVGGENSI